MNHLFVKVCGLKTKEQIDHAIACGYDAIGVVTYSKSKRYCSPFEALELAEYAKGKIKRFVVGVSYRDVQEVANRFDYTQIYEPIQIPNLVLASKERPPSNLKYDYFIFDASIGSGVFQQFPLWVKELSKEVIIAGGLDIQNISSVIREMRPFGVDVSSGVEKDGVKDLEMMQEFIRIARHC